MDEFDIVQNRAIGAHALYEFVRFYEQNHKKKDGPWLEYLLPILPMVFNEKIKKAIYKRNFSEGSLINVIAEDKSIFNTLQESMMKMSDLTLNSLDLAFKAELLLIDPQKKTLVILKSNIPSQDLNHDYLDILSASRRLGYWFSKLTPEQILHYFNITF